MAFAAPLAPRSALPPTQVTVRRKRILAPELPAPVPPPPQVLPRAARVFRIDVPPAPASPGKLLPQGQEEVEGADPDPAVADPRAPTRRADRIGHDTHGGPVSRPSVASAAEDGGVARATADATAKLLPSGANSGAIAQGDTAIRRATRRADSSRAPTRKALESSTGETTGLGQTGTTSRNAPDLLRHDNPHASDWQRLSRRAEKIAAELEAATRRLRG
jgi:hypothetical protein